MTDWKTNAAARSKAYTEKLKDPRWQKMRLQVLERDGWCCQLCFNGEDTLHVHHFYYERGREPWDYPIEAFTTLCESCHEDEGQGRHLAEQSLLLTLKKKGFMSWDLERMAEGFKSLPDGMVFMPVPDIVAFSLANHEMRMLMHDHYFTHLKEKRLEKEATEKALTDSPFADQ